MLENAAHRRGLTVAKDSMEVLVDDQQLLVSHVADVVFSKSKPVR